MLELGIFRNIRAFHQSRWSGASRLEAHGPSQRRRVTCCLCAASLRADPREELEAGSAPTIATCEAGAAGRIRAMAWWCCAGELRSRNVWFDGSMRKAGMRRGRVSRPSCVRVCARLGTRREDLAMGTRAVQNFIMRMYRMHAPSRAPTFSLHQGLVRSDLGFRQASQRLPRPRPSRLSSSINHSPYAYTRGGERQEEDAHSPRARHRDTD